MDAHAPIARHPTASTTGDARVLRTASNRLALGFGLFAAAAATWAVKGIVNSSTWSSGPPLNSLRAAAFLLAAVACWPSWPRARLLAASLLVAGLVDGIGFLQTNFSLPATVVESFELAGSIWCIALAARWLKEGVAEPSRLRWPFLLVAVTASWWMVIGFSNPMPWLEVGSNLLAVAGCLLVSFSGDGQ